MVRPWLLAVGVAGSLLIISSPRSLRAEGREGALRSLLTQMTKLAGDARIVPARVGVMVLDGWSGKPLVRIRADEQFQVAANAQLVIAAVALSQLGPEYKFKTTLYAGTVKGSLIPGDLYLKGFGDPSLLERDVWQLADDLHEHGIRRVQGGLVIDESYFASERPVSSYGDPRNERSPSGALSIDFNMLGVRVMGAPRAGVPARVLLRPVSGYLKLVNKTMTVSAERRSWVNIRTKAEPTAVAVEVAGRVRLGYLGALFRRPVADPGLLTGATLLEALRRRGITVEVSKITRGAVPEKSKIVAEHYSEPLAVVLRAISKQSNSFVAEQMLKVIGAEVHGAPGSSAKGLKVVGGYLARLKIRPGAYLMNDASGVEGTVRFSPEQMVTVVKEAALNFKTGHEFLAALPLAGVDGTLVDRFLGSPAERYLRAKPTTLRNGVVLTGVAGAAGRRGLLIFSICINELPRGKLEQARQLADEMAVALVAYLER